MESSNSATEDIENWFTYHKPRGDQPVRYEAIRAKAKELAYVIAAACPPSADRTVAFRHVRDAVMVANAAIACEREV